MNILVYSLFALLIAAMVIWVVLMGLALRGITRNLFVRNPVVPPVPDPKLEI